MVGQFEVEPVLTADDRAAGYYLQALVAQRNSDQERALQAMYQAVSLDPRTPRLRERIFDLFIRRGSLSRALEHATALQRLEPAEPRHRAEVAQILVALQRYEGAINEYLAVLEAEPAQREALLELGSLYGRLGERERSVEMFSRVTALAPDSLLANLALGRALSRLQRFEDALKALRHAAKLDPLHAEVQLHLGFVYHALGMRKKSFEAYHTAVDFDRTLGSGTASGSGGTDRMDAMMGLGAEGMGAALVEYDSLVDFSEDPLGMLSKLGLLDLHRQRYAAAARKFGIVLGARPGDDDVRYSLAFAYERGGDVVGAIGELLAVSKDSARYVDARLLVSNFLFEEGRVGEAIEAIDELLRTYPDSREGRQRLIALYRSEERYDEAISIAASLVASEPDNDGYVFSMAFLHNEAGRLDRSMELLRKVLRMNPRNHDALNHLGYLYAEKGVNLDEAEALIRRALALQPNSGAYIDSLGWVYFQRGDYEVAVKELEKAMRLAGRDPVIVEHLADAYVEVGRSLEALRGYRDCEARTDEGEQRERVRGKITELTRRVRDGSAALASFVREAG